MDIPTLVFRNSEYHQNSEHYRAPMDILTLVFRASALPLALQPCLTDPNIRFLLFNLAKSISVLFHTFRHNPASTRSSKRGCLFVFPSVPAASLNWFCNSCTANRHTKKKKPTATRAYEATCPFPSSSSSFFQRVFTYFHNTRGDRVGISGVADSAYDRDEGGRCRKETRGWRRGRPCSIEYPRFPNSFAATPMFFWPGEG